MSNVQITNPTGATHQLNVTADGTVVNPVTLLGAGESVTLTLAADQSVSIRQGVKIIAGPALT